MLVDKNVWLAPRAVKEAATKAFAAAEALRLALPKAAQTRSVISSETFEMNMEDISMELPVSEQEKKSFLQEFMLDMGLALKRLAAFERAVEALKHELPQELASSLEIGELNFSINGETKRFFGARDSPEWRAEQLYEAIEESFSLSDDEEDKEDHM